MSGSIFISYRRLDAGGHAGRLYDRLAQWFDADALFFDTEHIHVSRFVGNEALRRELMEMIRPGPVPNGTPPPQET